MQIRTIKTRALLPPSDDLLKVISGSIKKVPERSILVITSKVVSIWQGRCVSKKDFPNKDDLVKKEADKYLRSKFAPDKWIMHTIKHNLFIPSAGIDESNANGFYILWPRDLEKTVRVLYDWVKKTYRVKKFGVILTDSHTIPLRRGVIGISLAHYGFEPLRDYRGVKDIFGRKLVMTQMNIVDALAAAAVVLMGEGKEQTPLALITELSDIQFGQKRMGSSSALKIAEKEDLYYPFLSSVAWKKGTGGIKL